MFFFSCLQHDSMSLYVRSGVHNSPYIKSVVLYVCYFPSLYHSHKLYFSKIRFFMIARFNAAPLPGFLICNFPVSSSISTLRLLVIAEEFINMRIPYKEFSLKIYMVEDLTLVSVYIDAYVRENWFGCAKSSKVRSNLKTLRFIGLNDLKWPKYWVLHDFVESENLFSKGLVSKLDNIQSVFVWC